MVRVQPAAASWLDVVVVRFAVLVVLQVLASSDDIVVVVVVVAVDRGLPQVEQHLDPHADGVGEAMRELLLDLLVELGDPLGQIGEALQVQVIDGLLDLIEDVGEARLLVLARVELLQLLVDVRLNRDQLIDFLSRKRKRKRKTHKIKKLFIFSKKFL